MTTNRFVVISMMVMWVLFGCEDPLKCSSDDECREGYRCDLEVYVGECVEVIRVVRCGDQLCRAPEICIQGEGCRVVERGGSQAGTTSGTTTAGQTAGQAAGQLAGQTAGQTAGQIAGQTAGQTAGQLAGQIAGQAITGGSAGDLAGMSGGSSSGGVAGAMAGSVITDMSVVDMYIDPLDRDQGGQPCQTACDCTPGLACIEGRCDATSDPVYCCGGSFCPPNEACETSSGAADFCPETRCDTACDCQSGLSCIAGSCRLGDAPLFCCDSGSCPSGMDCETARGVRSMCPSTQCTTACDCTPGQRCVSGRCAFEGNPLFCCEGSPCPTGEICQSETGMASTCDASRTCVSACDCTPGMACEGGACIVLDAPVFCCESTQCPIGSTCEFSNGSRTLCE